MISSFAEDAFKNIWIGTESGGLNYYNRNNNSFTKLKNIPGNANSLSSNLIKKVFLDEHQNLWIGTHAGGLNKYNTKTKTFNRFNFSKTQEEIPDEVTSIAEDSWNCLWVATQHNGLQVSNAKKTEFHQFIPPGNLMKGESIKSLLVAKNKNIYIGTTSGLFIYNKIKSEFYSIKRPKAKSPIPYYVNCITETNEGLIYLATGFDGLVLYDQKQNKIINYTISGGLPNNNVLGILEDDHKNLWISTANGLSMFDPKSKKFKNYTVADGLPGNEFNLNAYYKSKNGEFFFGGYNGFISFYPDNIQTNTKASAVVLTDLKINNKSVEINPENGLLKEDLSLTDKLTLNSNQNTFTINFALLNFIKPEKNKYLYQLKGFEQNPNEVKIPEATYTNLPAGSYTFLVKGINNDGVFSENTKELKIVVNPPFYQTWWAYSVYMCVVAGVLFIVVRYLLIRAVLKNEKEANEHKLEFFTNISHEIRTPLTLIVGPLEKLMDRAKDNPSLNRDLQPIKNNADRLMNLVTELLDFRKAESGKMSLQISPGNIIKFSGEIFIAFQNMAISKEIDYTFKSDAEHIEMYFDKVQMEKVLFNLLSNAFKFTPNGGKISLEIIKENDWVNIKVYDNGKGIPLNNQINLFQNFYQANSNITIGTGLGLSFSKSIVELHHGKISFQSQPETKDKQGYTCFSVRLKTGKTHFNPSDFIGDYVYYDDAVNYNLPKSQESLLIEENSNDQKNKKYNILLVKDNDEVRAFIKNSLAATYNIYESENGLKGVETALELIPDLIISDVMMPVMDGLELCRTLKTDERTSHIPIVLLTARSAYVHQINGFENGADAYIMKPFNLKILELNIHNLLNARETIKQKFAGVITLEPKNLVINSTEQNFLSKIIGIIENHMADTDFDVPKLAAEIGMSQPVLYKKIRALTDLSVNDFIKSLRIKRAAQLLKQNAGNISDVAYALGFNDRKYFSLEFKKAFGKTPTEFMQERNV